MNSNTFLSVFCPAKLNLFLHITGRRANGYHDLQTLFELVDYGDDLKVALSGVNHFDDNQNGDESCHDAFWQSHRAYTMLANTIKVTSNKEYINTLKDKDNLIKRAAIAYFQRAKLIPKACHIELVKRIPAGAGLGGGSSNAAGVLIGLNQMLGNKLKTAELHEIAFELGADVPIFVHRQSAFAQGLGERLYDIELPQRYYLIITPPVHANTRKIFNHPALTRNTEAIKVAPPLEGLAQAFSGPFETRYKNDFQSVYTALGDEAVLSQTKDLSEGSGWPQASIVTKAQALLDKCIRKVLLDCGVSQQTAVHSDARLSGSGASFFVAFEHSPVGIEIAHNVRDLFRAKIRSNWARSESDSDLSWHIQTASTFTD